MKIADYAVASESSHSYSMQESIMYAKYRVAEVISPKEDKKLDGKKNDDVSISDEARNRLEDAENNGDAEDTEKTEGRSTRAGRAKRSGGLNSNIRDLKELKLQMVRMLMRRLLGRDLDFSEETLAESMRKNRVESLNDLSNTMSALRNDPRPNVTTYDVTEFKYFRQESESVSYHTAGLIRTQDGREISIDISMSMSREAAEYFEFTKKREADPSLDPIIINYAGGIPELSGHTFSFDLDFDGKKDNIAFAGAGSGFLAIDKNGDGIINDGRELFGPSSGNGFSELRQADMDGNGWIDENDEIFSKLRIWSKDEDGNDVLYTLKDVGVGAIYLGESSTEFSLSGGNMRSTSFYLKEDGGAGLLSHIDLKL